MSFASPPGRYIISLSLLLALGVLIAFAPSLNTPFLSDDYIHLTNAKNENFAALIHRVLLAHPTGGDLFFRPVGSIYYWLVFRVASQNSRMWHAGSLAIHAANTVLLFLLALRLNRRLLPSLFGAVLFAWHGSHVEDVCWLAAVFDLLAAYFVLLVLLLVTKLQVTPLSHVIVIASSALACLSKESAYCLPLLVACLALFVPHPQRSQILRRSLQVGIACTGVFLYRTWFLQGVGGYRTPSGSSIASTLRPISVLQALTLRIWGVLFMPVNWSHRPNAWLAMAAVGMLISLVVLAANKSGMRHANLFPAMLLALVASLPALPLLLIGPNLAGSRVLYLPSIGFSLLWICIIQSVKTKSAALALGSSMLLFQLAALLHNQRIWVNLAQTARLACLDAARIQEQNPNVAIAVYDLPATLQGVYFFQNGFPQCVALAEGVNAAKVQLLPKGVTNQNTQAVVWNDTTGRIELLKK